MIVVANGSPYHTQQQAARREQVGARARETGLPFVYVNRVGGQDELVFDGASFVMDAHGDVVQQLPGWHETVALVTLDRGAPRPVRGTLDPRLEYHVYEALVMGVRDYVTKNRFPGVLLGLSGGVDSALVLAVAVDALGRGPRARGDDAFAVYALDQPRRCAGDGGDRRRALQRDPHRADVRARSWRRSPDEFKGLPPDAAEENIQARIRGTLLMALSNKLGSIVLTTGNKSEMAVGYATLYGDMAGGFARAEGHQQDAGLPALRLPQRARPRDPGADHHARAVGRVAARPGRPGFAAAVRRARRDPRGLRRARQEPGRHRRDGLSRPSTCGGSCELIKINEYKRRQAAVGIRITPRGFGRDWRYPITSAWHEWESVAP